MALRPNLLDLSLRLGDLVESVDSLRRAALDIYEERALGLAALVADECEVAKGFLDEARAALADALRALDPPVDFESARVGVLRVKDGFLEAVVRLDALRTRRLRDVANEGSEIGPNGVRWAATVRRSFDDCRSHAWEAVGPFFASFEEITERMAAGAVSVQTTSIGQQINVGEEEAADPGSLAGAALRAGVRAVSIPGGQP